MRNSGVYTKASQHDGERTQVALAAACSNEGFCSGEAWHHHQGEGFRQGRHCLKPGTSKQMSQGHIHGLKIKELPPFGNCQM